MASLVALENINKRIENQYYQEKEKIIMTTRFELSETLAKFNFLSDSIPKRKIGRHTY